MMMEIKGLKGFKRLSSVLKIDEVGQNPSGSRQTLISLSTMLQNPK